MAVDVETAAALPERDFEPGEHQAVRWWAFAAAALVAAGLAVLAPSAWPDGRGWLRIAAGGAQAEIPVTFGSATPVETEVALGEERLAVSVPGGFPPAGRVVVAVTVVAGAGRLSAEDLTVGLRVPDGREEAIPVTRVEEGGREAEASRRPPADAAVVLGLLGAVITLWITEAVPLFVTALAIPVVLSVTGVTAPAEALAPFFHPIIALFFAGFLMARAMARVGLDRLAAVSIVAAAGRTPVLLFAGLLGTAAFFSMWMSNTAATAILIPVALAVTEPLDSPGFRRAVVLGIAYATAVGGVASAIGTPANPLAIEYLDSFVGRRVSFIEWFGFGLPIAMVFLPVMGAYLWWAMRPGAVGERFAGARRAALAEFRSAGRLSRDQATVLAVFLGVIGLWVTETWHGFETGIVALAGALVLMLAGRIRPDDLGRISWPALLTFGGGLTLGLAITDSGMADWVATRLTVLSSWPSLLAVATVALVTVTLTAAASNTACAAMLIPLAIPLAGILGVSPTMLVVLVAIASSIDFALVIGTPPTMVAYSTGLYTAGGIFRVGAPLDLIGAGLLVTVAAWTWDLLGLI
jgi:sodium-dependent dicarboxylate transporter 2/3/5